MIRIRHRLIVDYLGCGCRTFEERIEREVVPMGENSGDSLYEERDKIIRNSNSPKERAFWNLGNYLEVCGERENAIVLGGCTNFSGRYHCTHEIYIVDDQSLNEIRTQVVETLTGIYQIRGALICYPLDIGHCFEQIAAENEGKAISVFLQRTNVALVSRPIINGHQTLRGVNKSEGHLGWASYNPIRDPREIKDRLRYFNNCDRALMDLGGYTFCGGPILHTQLNSESGRNRI